MAYNTATSHGRGGSDFVSKRDGWLVALFWSAQFVILWSMYVTVVDPGSGVALKVSMVALLSATCAFTMWVLYGTRYGFSRNTLIVQSGPLKWRVPLGEIDSVRPSRNPLSAPATSLDRLHVRYGTTGILISPEDKSGFLRALVARAPQLEVVGDSAERRDRATPDRSA